MHDIDDLAQKSDPGSGRGALNGGFGWVACTTDNVLSVKSNLYDLLVTLPNRASTASPAQTWPTMITSSGQEVKASQRDLRRYKTLRQSQQRSADLAGLVSPYPTTSTSSMTAVEGDADDESTRLLPAATAVHNDVSDDAAEQLIEPLSWSALAYNSFIWWASAGEKRTDLDEEAERDAAMFRDFNAYADTPASSKPRRLSSPSPATPIGLGEGAAGSEMAIIGFFHRLTVSILSTLAEVVDSHDAEPGERELGNSENEEKSPVYVSGDDMVHMGLDVWSDSDRRFVEELLELYWGRKATVQGGRIECCGVRLL